MEEISKEELIKRLKILRDGKDKDSSFRINQEVFAMCYAPVLKSADFVKYFGKRICAECGKEFGENFDEVLKIIRNKIPSMHYSMYTKAKGKKIDSPYFEYRRDVRWIENMAEDYKKNGYNVKLRFYCLDCQKKGFPFVYFNLKIGNEIIRSIPSVEENEDSRNTSSYTDYRIALEFLRGINTYDKLLEKFDNLAHTIIKKPEIDKALQNILGLDIKYSKDEIIKTISKYSTYDNFNAENIFLLNTIMGDFDDDYLFTLNDYYNIEQLFSEYNLNLKYMPPLISSSIIKKLSRKYLKGEKQFYVKEEVFDYLKRLFPKEPDYLKSEDKKDEFYLSEKQKMKFIYNHVIDLVKMLYLYYSDTFEFEITKFKDFIIELKDRINDDMSENIKRNHKLKKEGKLESYDIFSFTFNDLIEIIEGDDV